MYRLRIIHAASQPQQSSEMRMYLNSFVLVFCKHKGEEVKRVSQLSVPITIRREKTGSSCLGNLRLKREQKRSNVNSTPNHCVCYLNLCSLCSRSHYTLNMLPRERDFFTSQTMYCETARSVLTSLTDLTSLNPRFSTSI